MCFDWYIKVYRCVFHCEIVEDAEKVKQEEKAYKKIPIITDFTDEEGNDRMKEMIQESKPTCGKSSPTNWNASRAIRRWRTCYNRRNL